MPPTEQLIRLGQANVLGIGISAVDMGEALSSTEELLRRRCKGYISVTGVHGVMEAQRDPAFRQTLNRSLLCLPDGMPTVWVGRLQRHRTMGRVYGPDFMMEMCRRAVSSRTRHFLYGGKPGVAETLQRNLERQVPGIIICGTYTPPFRLLTVDEEQAVVETVREAKPDIIWVGLSTPKQERFMARTIERLDCCLMIGVGAAFDIHAGLLVDAPAWMKSCGLQWLHRLCKEPRRLWRRYLHNNPAFLWNIALQFTGLKHFASDRSTAPS